MMTFSGLGQQESGMACTCVQMYMCVYECTNTSFYMHISLPDLDVHIKYIAYHASHTQIGTHTLFLLQCIQA